MQVLFSCQTFYVEAPAHMMRNCSTISIAAGPSAPERRNNSHFCPENFLKNANLKEITVKKATQNLEGIVSLSWVLCSKN